MSKAVADRPVRGGFSVMPLGSRVIVRLVGGEQKSAGGILMPDSAEKDKWAEIVAGTIWSESSTAAESPALLAGPGSRVLLPSYESREKFHEGGVEYLVYDAKEILAVRR